MVSQADESQAIKVVEFQTLFGANVYSINTAVNLTLNVELLATKRVSDFAPHSRLALSSLFPDCQQDALVSQFIADAIQYADRELCREMNFHSSPTIAFVNDGVPDAFSVAWESDDPQMSRAAALAVVEAVDEAARRGDPTQKYTQARDVSVEKAKSAGFQIRPLFWWLQPRGNTLRSSSSLAIIFALGMASIRSNCSRQSPARRRSR